MYLDCCVDSSTRVNTTASDGKVVITGDHNEVSVSARESKIALAEIQRKLESMVERKMKSSRRNWKPWRNDCCPLTQFKKTLMRWTKPLRFCPKWWRSWMKSSQGNCESCISESCHWTWPVKKSWLQWTKLWKPWTTRFSHRKKPSEEWTTPVQGYIRRFRRFLTGYLL